METAQLLSHPSGRIREWIWRPVRKFAQLMSQVPEAVARLGRRLRDTANLVLRTLDEVTPQTTRVQARSQVEWVVGPLTFSVASGVIFARASSNFPE